MNDPSRAYVMTLVSAGCSLAKRATVIDGVVCSTADPPWPSRCAFTPVEITDPEDLLQVLSTVAEERIAPCVVRAEPKAETGRRAIYDHRTKGPAGMFPAPRAWVGFDIEKVPNKAQLDPMRDGEAISTYVLACLPPAVPPQHPRLADHRQRGEAPGRAALPPLVSARQAAGRQATRDLVQAGHKSGLDRPLHPDQRGFAAFPRSADRGRSAGPVPAALGHRARGIRLRSRPRHHRARRPAPPRRRGFSSVGGGNLDALRTAYGPRFETRRGEAVAEIRAHIETVRAAGKGARHPSYLRAAAAIEGICRYWCIPIEGPREELIEAYESTLTPDEKLKREKGSTEGVWDWIGSQLPPVPGGTQPCSPAGQGGGL